MSEIIRANFPLLKEYQNNFSNEKDHFIHFTSATFFSSYIKQCSDPYISKMANKLDSLYRTTNQAYSNIERWWVSYNADLEGLETALSSDSRAGAISDSSVHSYVMAKLPGLMEYQINYGGIIPNLVIASTDNVQFSEQTVDTNGVNSKFKEGSVSEVSPFSNLSMDLLDWSKNNLFPLVIELSNNAVLGIESVGATVAVGAQSVVEGAFSLVESGVDLVAVGGTAVFSVVTGLFDGGQAIYGAASGEEWSSVTKKMWSGTMGFVSTKHVSGWFDQLYQNTAYGNWLTEHGFSIVRPVVTGISRVAGTVVLAMSTFGVGGVISTGGTLSASSVASMTSAGQIAATAGVVGTSEGIQNAWADGAGLGKGLGVGALSGLWDSFQFYLGGKISSLNLFRAPAGMASLKQNFYNGIARIVLDGTDAAMEGFVQPLLKALYRDGYQNELGVQVEFTEGQSFLENYWQLFEENGGIGAVLTNATIGSAASFLGEAFQLSKYFDTKKGKGIINGVKVGDNYQLPKNLFPDDLLQEMVVDCNELGSLSWDTGKQLENMFFDTNYMIGVHRTGMQPASSILENGLRLTGHSSSGVNVKNTISSIDDLELNISFFKKSAYGYLNFINALKTSGYYKSEGLGDVIIVKIPNADIDNIPSLVDSSSGTPILKSDCLTGYLTCDHGNMSDFKTK